MGIFGGRHYAATDDRKFRADRLRHTHFGPVAILFGLGSSHANGVHWIRLDSPSIHLRLDRRFGSIGSSPSQQRIKMDLDRDVCHWTPALCQDDSTGHNARLGLDFRLTNSRAANSLRSFVHCVRAKLVEREQLSLGIDVAKGPPFATMQMSTFGDSETASERR